MGEISEALRRAKSAKPIPSRPSIRRPGEATRSQTLARNGERPEPADNLEGADGTIDLRNLQPTDAVPDSYDATENDAGVESGQEVAISRDHGDYRAARVLLNNIESPAAASARQFAQRVKRKAKQNNMNAIVVTSPISGDGKTTTSCNLAIALTALDRSHTVALVDLDLRRPSVSRTLGIIPKIGVEDVLANVATVDQALLATDVPGLSVMGVRRASSTPEHLLGSENLRGFIDSLTARFSTVIIDTPPILASSDAISVLDVADGCILVVRARKSPSKSVLVAMKHLPMEKMLGSCLNFATAAEVNTNYYSYSTTYSSPADESEQDPKGESTREKTE